MSPKRGNPGLRGRLLEKSIESFIAALETINCLSRVYRVEGFLTLICNAWELLLKVRLIDQNGGDKSVIFRKKEKNKRLESHSLEHCLGLVFPQPDAALRRNLERVIELRNESVHLVISKLPSEIMAMLQSCVLNYHKHLNTWFEKSLSQRVSIGLMNLVYDAAPESFDLKNKVLRKQLGKETFEFLARYQKELMDEFNALGKPAEFSLGIEYHVALVKQLPNGDFTLQPGPNGEPTMVVEVAKDSGKSHPYRFVDVVTQLEAVFGKHDATSRYEIQCVVESHDIRKRSDFYYNSGITGSPNQFSVSFVGWLIEQKNKDVDFFQKARQKARLKNKSAAGD